MSAPEAASWGVCQSQGDRAQQEDEVGAYAGDDYALLVVADGMGGHAAGAEASSLVVHSFIDHFPDSQGAVPDRLRQCAYEANASIVAAVDENPDFEGMGSTVVAVVVAASGVLWVSVGDSPLWLFRNGGLTRLNADHSVAGFLAGLVKQGRMTAEQAAADPTRNQLRSAISGVDIDLIDNPAERTALQVGDKLIIASDGVLTLGEADLAACVVASGDADDDAVAAQLVGAVVAAGRERQDNISVMVHTCKTATEGVQIVPEPPPPKSATPTPAAPRKDNTAGSAEDETGQGDRSLRLLLIGAGVVILISAALFVFEVV